MLNRRTLRIKAMQMMFAYRQMIEANEELAREFLRVKYSPDMNSMEFQDVDELGKKREESIAFFNDNFHNQTFSPEKDNEIQESVSRAYGQYAEQNRLDLSSTRKQMVQDVDQLYSTYISFLELLLEFHHQAEIDEKRDHSNFVKNMLIQGLKLNKSLERAILDSKFRWEGRSEVREWFLSLLIKDENFISYNELESPSFEEDHKIVKHLISKIIFANEVIETFLEESDLHWDENKPVIKSLLVKTLKSIPEEQGEFDLQQVSYNFEEDKEFFVKLFDSAVSLPDEYRDLIGTKAQNWDIERLATTDRIILELAIAELINFPSIPVKVTINEYIEVSKKYSTPKSKKFINGMLDVIAENLKNEGKLRKSGRGLIDNK